MYKLTEPSGFDDSGDAVPTGQSPQLNIYKLRKCMHMLHLSCLKAYLENNCKVMQDEHHVMLLHPWGGGGGGGDLCMRSFTTR